MSFTGWAVVGWEHASILLDGFATDFDQRSCLMARS